MLAIVCALVLGVSVLAQFIPAAAYCALLRSAKPAATFPSLGKFCVGMPLRGADPYLKAAIESFLDQDYPDVELRIIVDNVNDPAWEVAHATVRDLNATNVHISALKTRSSQCSLLCSSQAQFLEELDESCEFVGFAAGDTIVPRDWLQNMAAALADETVGATLGNVWYVPVGNHWGTLAKYLWNAGGVVPMWMFEMPWAGALAMRRKTVLQIGLLGKLRCGMIEDSPVKPTLDKLGLKCRFLPQLVLPNREETNLRGCWNYIQRQLLWVRLYHPHWWFVVFNASLTTAVMFAPFVLAALALAAGQNAAGLLIAGAAVGNIVALLLLTLMLESSVRQAVAGRMQPLPKLSVPTVLGLLVAIPLTQLIHLVSVLNCLGRRSVTWRGVKYEIEGPWNVRVVEDSSSQAVVSEPA